MNTRIGKNSPLGKLARRPKTEESEQDEDQEPETEYPGLTQFGEDHVIVELHIPSPSESQSTMRPFSTISKGKIFILFLIVRAVPALPNSLFPFKY
jgi:hypothetical protein